MQISPLVAISIATTHMLAPIEEVNATIQYITGKHPESRLAIDLASERIVGKYPVLSGLNVSALDAALSSATDRAARQKVCDEWAAKQTAVLGSVFVW